MGYFLGEGGVVGGWRVVSCMDDMVAGICGSVAVQFLRLASEEYQGVLIKSTPEWMLRAINYDAPISFARVARKRMG